MSNTEDPDARPHHPDDLLKTRPRIGHHGEDEVQGTLIETRVGHVQPFGVQLPHGPSAKDPKHPGRYISRDHLDARGKLDQVQSGPRADDEDAFPGSEGQEIDRPPPRAPKPMIRS